MRSLLGPPGHKEFSRRQLKAKGYVHEPSRHLYYKQCIHACPLPGSHICTFHHPSFQHIAAPTRHLLVHLFHLDDKD